MRMMMKVTLPNESFNAAMKAGTAVAKLSKILETIKPEAAYFTEMDGLRGGILIVEMADASKIPALAEPWYLAFNATVEFRVVMTPDDLKKTGIEELGKKWA